MGELPHPRPPRTCPSLTPPPRPRWLPPYLPFLHLPFSLFLPPSQDHPHPLCNGRSLKPRGSGVADRQAETPTRWHPGWPRRPASPPSTEQAIIFCVFPSLPPSSRLLWGRKEGRGALCWPPLCTPAFAAWLQATCGGLGACFVSLWVSQQKDRETRLPGQIK